MKKDIKSKSRDESRSKQKKMTLFLALSTYSQVYYLFTIELNDDMRRHLVTITEESGVQVEPARVTKILDTFKAKIPNLIMCGVPGAGGDDAVSFIPKYRSTSSISLLQKMLQLIERPSRLRSQRQTKNLALTVVFSRLS